MTDKTFQRLLLKIDTSFSDRIIQAKFDNGYYGLEASFDVPSDEIEIKFYENEDEKIILSESQENAIIKLMEKCYNDNIEDWNEQNADDIKEDFIAHKADARREEAVLG